MRKQTGGVAPPHDTRGIAAAAAELTIRSLRSAGVLPLFWRRRRELRSSAIM
jgi:hypothetical protein